MKWNVISRSVESMLDRAALSVNTSQWIQCAGIQFFMDDAMLFCPWYIKIVDANSQNKFQIIKYCCIGMIKSNCFVLIHICYSLDLMFHGPLFIDAT